ncbi:MAG: hypothetical protein EOP15_19740, partial [Pseudomonas sp.]
MNGKRTLSLISASLAIGGLSLFMQTAQAQMGLPDAVKVPDGNKVMMETVGVGEITYECRDKVDAAGQTEW